MHYTFEKPGIVDRAYRQFPFRIRFSILIILVLAMAAPVSAYIITVHTLNPGDSIQENITSANSGDTIILNPGTYSQNGITVSKSIIIMANA